MDKTRLAEKRYELNIKRALFREQIEIDKEIQTKLLKTKGESIIDKDIDLGRFFELASSDKIYVTGLNLYEFQKKNY